MSSDDENPLRRFLNQKNPKDHWPDEFNDWAQEWWKRCEEYYSKFG